MARVCFHLHQRKLKTRQRHQSTRLSHQLRLVSQSLWAWRRIWQDSRGVFCEFSLFAYKCSTLAIVISKHHDIVVSKHRDKHTSKRMYPVRHHHKQHQLAQKTFRTCIIFLNRVVCWRIIYLLDCWFSVFLIRRLPAKTGKLAKLVPDNDASMLPPPMAKKEPPGQTSKSTAMPPPAKSIPAKSGSDTRKIHRCIL